FRRAVEREQPPGRVGRREAARQAVDHVLAERLEVGQLRRRFFELRARSTQTFRQIAAERRGRHESEDAEAHRVDRDARGRKEVSAYVRQMSRKNGYPGCDPGDLIWIRIAEPSSTVTTAARPPISHRSLLRECWGLGAGRGCWAEIGCWGLRADAFPARASSP